MTASPRRLNSTRDRVALLRSPLALPKRRADRFWHFSPLLKSTGV
ncbi:MAG: hypothetical protein AB1589_35340 [Cyanobacteriota bacterium]